VPQFLPGGNPLPCILLFRSISSDFMAPSPTTVAPTISSTADAPTLAADLDPTDEACDSMVEVAVDADSAFGCWVPLPISSVAVSLRQLVDADEEEAEYDSTPLPHSTLVSPPL
jgi:hypothetical protein